MYKKINILGGYMKIIKVGAMWCPACIVTNKYWKEIKKEYEEIEFVDYDLDMDEEEVKSFGLDKLINITIQP